MLQPQLKIHLVVCVTRGLHYQSTKLIRTDTTLDLSQKAEKMIVEKSALCLYSVDGDEVFMVWKKPGIVLEQDFCTIKPAFILPEFSKKKNVQVLKTPQANMTSKAKISLNRTRCGEIERHNF
jgi:hypothetical protein